MAKDCTVTLKGGVEVFVPAAVIDGFVDEVYDAIFAEGLKAFLSKGMAGTKDEKIGAKDVEKIEAKAKANLQNLVEGKLKAGRAKKAKGVSGPVMVEARRLAKNAIKQEAKRQGVKVSHIEAKDLTAWANQLLESEAGKGLIAQAEANLSQAGATTLFEGINIAIKADDKKAMKANAKAEKAAREKEAAKKFVPQKPGQKPAAMHA